MAQKIFPMLGSTPDETYILPVETPMENQEAISELASELYKVLYYDKHSDGHTESKKCSADEVNGPCSFSEANEFDVKDAFLEMQDTNNLPESVCELISETISPVTHIEIIKSGSRRVSGANRVVPFLTSALKTGKLGFTDSKLSEVYKVFLSDFGNNDSNTKCMMCHKTLLSCRELEQHVRNVHAVDVTVDLCFVCRKKYVFQNQLQIHLNHAHSISCSDLICKICFMEFNTTMEQRAHERKHDESHTCHVCTKKFSSEYLYQKHLNQHIFQVKPNECKKCDRRFKNVVALNVHKKRHLNVKCTMCNINYLNDTDLLLHMKDHKTEDITKFLRNVEEMDQKESELEEMLTLYAKLTLKTKTNTDGDPEKSSQENSILDCVNTMLTTVSQTSDKNIKNQKGTECRLCRMNVSTEKELFDHHRQFHLRNRTCPFCGKRNRSVSQTWRHMNSHLKNKVNISKISVQNDKNLESHSGNSKDCSEASSSSKTKQPRKNYSRLYSCDICSRKFLYPGSRDNHVLLHSKDKCENWKCTECGQLFSHPELLLTHASTHKPSMQCKICDKIFSSKNGLQSHIKTHYGEGEKRMFKCNMCSVECPSLTGLQNHRRCHTGERPYTCALCHRKFKRRQAVKKHFQVVHNSASLQYHTCSHCPRTFNCTGNLIRHYVRVHCQVRRFICGICGSRFSQNQDLRRHFKIWHEVEMPNINGSDRKSLKEIYVIPDIDDLSESNPHALKIKAIVAEEKAKFSGLSELLLSKGINEEDTSTKSVVKLINNFSKQKDEYAIDSVQTSIGDDTIPKEPSGNTDEEYVEGEIFFEDNYDSGKLCTYNSNNNNNNNNRHHHHHHHLEKKVYLCEHCNKNFSEENEYMEHVAERSKSYMCSQCALVFCDQSLLDEHLSTEHNIFQCSISVNDVNNEENHSQHEQNIDDVQLMNSMANMSHQSCPVEQGKTLMAAIGQQEATVLPNIVTHASHFAANSGIDGMVISKHALPVHDSMDSNNISTTLNINGVILQNVIIQQPPAVIQSVPLGYQNQELVNSAYPITPFVTISSSGMPLLDSNTSFLNVNEAHTITSCVESANSLTTSEKVSESVNQNLENMKINSVGRINVKTCGEDMKHKDIIDKPNSADRNDKKSDENKEIKKLKCKFCDEKFCNTAALNRHKSTHAESKPFGCPQCGKHFAEKHNLKSHMMTHTGERPYKCEECGKQMRYRTDFNDHKRMHLGEKPFVCEECGRKFIRRRELSRHKLIHTGEKKHMCPICGKMFGRLDQLKDIHLPTHSDSSSQTLHTCRICYKSFKLISKLKLHEILHSGVKKYKCELCEKCFALDVYLKAHMRCHTKRDNYIQCPKCPRQFVSEATLQVHEKTFHVRLEKGSKSSEKANQGTNNNDDDSLFLSENVELDERLGADIEIHGVDLSILDTNNYNAVIYLQMASKDLKLTLDGVSN